MCPEHFSIRRGFPLDQRDEADQNRAAQKRYPSPPDQRLRAMAAQEHAESGSDNNPVLAALGFDPLGLDALVARTGMDTASLQVMLLELELDGRVARLPGGLFQRLGRG